MVYGLQSTRISDVGAIEYLTVITKIIEGSVRIRVNENSTEQYQRFTAREISMILYGMQGLRSVNEGTLHKITQSIVVNLHCLRLLSTLLLFM